MLKMSIGILRQFVNIANINLIKMFSLTVAMAFSLIAIKRNQGNFGLL